MSEKLYSYADKQVMDEVGSGSGGGGGDGGGISPLIIHGRADVVEGSLVLDKTWKEVHDHVINGGTAFVVTPDIPGEAYDKLCKDPSTEQRYSFQNGCNR